MDDEHWLPVVGYETLYEVSSYGRVRSLTHVVTTNRVVKGKVQTFSWTSPGKLLKYGKRSDGYPDVPLTKQGVSENICVHRLVAEAFLPNPSNLKCINHKDGDKKNNHVENLEWCTFQSNVLHAVSHGFNPQAVPVYCVETNTTYPSMGQAESALHLPKGTICTEIKKNRFTHGYTFIKQEAKQCC